LKFIYILISLFLFTLSCTQAQQKIFSFPIKVIEPHQVRAIADDSGASCFYISLGDKSHFYSIPASGDTFYHHVFTQRFGHSVIEINAVINTDKNFVFFYSLVSEGKLSGAFVVNKANGNTTDVKDLDFADPGPNANLAKVISDNNCAYFIYSYPKKQQVGLLRLDDYNRSAFKLFTTDLPRTDKYFKASTFKKINMNMPNTIYQAHFPEKVYVQGNGQIIFTIDINKQNDIEKARDLGSTRMLTLDWNTGKSVYRNIPNDIQPVNYETNSFLFEDKLFRLSLNGKELNLSIINAESNITLKRFHFSNLDSVTIQSTPVVIEGARNVFQDGKQIVGEHDNILKKLDAGFPAVSVYSYQDSLLVASIGSYTEAQKPITFYLSYGPAFVAVPGPGFFTTGKGQSTSFKSVFSNASADFSSQPYQPNSLDKVFDFLYEHRKEKLGQNITYQSGNKICLGYIHRENKTFNVVAFE